MIKGDNLDCSECISQYKYLKAYIFNNSNIADKLEKAFRTGIRTCFQFFFTSHTYSAPIGINEDANITGKVVRPGHICDYPFFFTFGNFLALHAKLNIPLTITLAYSVCLS